MQTLNLNSFNLAPLTLSEYQEYEGGLIWFVIAGACVLIAGCGNGSGNQVNTYVGSGNHNTTTFRQDSVTNSSSAHGHLEVPLPVKK